MAPVVADYTYSTNCRVVGYEVEEVIPMIELFYGCILCSGADSCLGLANTIFGSHEAMVEAMNEKVAELGLSETTHFTDTTTQNGFTYEIAETVRCIRSGHIESPVVPHRDTITCAQVFDRITEATRG